MPVVATSGKLQNPPYTGGSDGRRSTPYSVSEVRFVAALCADERWPGSHTAPSVVGQHEDLAFMTITNYGEDDVLVGLTCAVADSVELRAAVPAEVGTKTRSLSSIPIPANSTLEFKPQGYHLAFVGLNYSFAPGERIATTLKFASGVELPVEFQVVAPGEVAGK